MLDIVVIKEAEVKEEAQQRPRNVSVIRTRIKASG